MNLVSARMLEMEEAEDGNEYLLYSSRRYLDQSQELPSSDEAMAWEGEGGAGKAARPNNS